MLVKFITNSQQSQKSFRKIYPTQKEKQILFWLNDLKITIKAMALKYSIPSPAPSLWEGEEQKNNMETASCFILCVLNAAREEKGKRDF